MWGIFVWSVLPTGAALVIMLASAQPLAVTVASAVLSTPIRISAFQLSLASAMSAFCSAVSLITFLALRRAETRVEAAVGDPLASAFGQDYRQQTSAFHWGRNFYISLLGLTLWVMAWRLKAVADAGQLLPPRSSGRRMSLAARVLYMLAGVVMLLMADVPMCRLNYNMQLAWYVTPAKEKLMNSVGKCQGAMRGDSGQLCRDWCDKAFALSHERLDTIMSARNQHILGKFAAELFDGARGVGQGEQRIEELFKKKTCEDVLRSVDKSNMLVNAACMFFAGIAIIGAFSCLSSSYSGDTPLPEPSAPPPPPEEATNAKKDE